MTEQSKGIKFITAEEVAARMGKSKSWVWNKTNPKSKSYDPMSAPRRQVYNGTRFVESEVEQWFAQLIQNGQKHRAPDGAIDTVRAVQKQSINDAASASSESREKSNAARKVGDARPKDVKSAGTPGAKSRGAIEKSNVDSKKGKRYVEVLGRAFDLAVKGGQSVVNQALGNEEHNDPKKVLKRMVKISTGK